MKELRPEFHLLDGSTHRLDDGAVVGEMPLMPCDGAGGWNFERVARDRYRLALAVPGFDDGDIDVSADGGCLRITGESSLAGAEGELLHRGLDATLGRSFLMLRPLDVTAIDVRCGLLRIDLRDRPGAGVQPAPPPRLESVEAIALAA